MKANLYKKPNVLCRNVVSVLFLAVFSVPVHAAVYYKITDLTRLFPGQPKSGGFVPVNISDNGLVVGYHLERPSVTVPFHAIYKIYNSNTGKLSAELKANGEVFGGSAMNSKGQIAGGTADIRVIRNTDGSVTQVLGSIPSPNVAGPIALSNNGYQALIGGVPFLKIDCRVYPYKAYVSNPSYTGFQELHSFQGEQGTIRANDINNNRQVVGSSSTDLPSMYCYDNAVIRHAYISLPGSPGKIADLHLKSWPNLSGMGSEANAINDNGKVVGYYTYALGAPYRGHYNLRTRYNHAVIWDTTNNTVKTFVDRNPFKSTTLNDINARNTIVGNEVTFTPTSFIPESEHAMVGNATSGLRNLNNLVVGNPLGLQLYNATKINARGQILVQAKGSPNGGYDVHNFLLTPFIL